MANNTLMRNIELNLQQFVGQPISPQTIALMKDVLDRETHEVIGSMLQPDNIKIMIKQSKTDRTQLRIKIGPICTPKLVAVDFEQPDYSNNELRAMNSHEREIAELSMRLRRMGYGDDLDAGKLLYPAEHANAVVGVAEAGFHNTQQPVLLVSKRAVVSRLMQRDGMTEEEALEFFDFNISGAYVGYETPIFVETL